MLKCVVFCYLVTYLHSMLITVKPRLYWTSKLSGVLLLFSNGNKTKNYSFSQREHALPYEWERVEDWTRYFIFRSLSFTYGNGRPNARIAYWNCIYIYIYLAKRANQVAVRQWPLICTASIQYTYCDRLNMLDFYLAGMFVVVWTPFLMRWNRDGREKWAQYTS